MRIDTAGALLRTFCICLSYIGFLFLILSHHTCPDLLIYHFHEHMNLFWRLPTGLVIAAPLFCIQMRPSQRSLFVS